MTRWGKGMKPIKRLMLSGGTVLLVDVNLILEISASGRGFITVQTEKDYSGKLVRLDIGYPERVLRWFTGFVERTQPAGKGFQRLFVREMSGIFDRPWLCSFQHPTLRQIAEWIQAQSGLTVVLPTASNDTDPPFPILPTAAAATSYWPLWGRHLLYKTTFGNRCRTAVFTWATPRTPCLLANRSLSSRNSARHRRQAIP